MSSCIRLTELDGRARRALSKPTVIPTVYVVYLVPDDVNPYLATVGEIAIDSLSQEGGTLLEPRAANH